MEAAPFVLIDRPQGALLYERAAEIVETREPDEVRACFRRLEGRHAAGFVSYEAGHSLEPKLEPLCHRPKADDLPLLWFGLFGEPRPVELSALLPDPAGAWASPPRPLVARADYEQAAETVIAHIEAGDIYQANLSFPAEVRFEGHPLALYAAIRERAAAAHGGIVFTGSEWILSFSPELFFAVAQGRVTTRPMKGTAERRPDPREDAGTAEELRLDPKQRAENLMIVDLLRNDLSLVCRPGSVKVPSLFEIETYPTVHQMTSTVVGTLEAGLGPVELLEALFPCGSVTGAPKIRAMEIIAGLERRRRGIYTGAIGRLAPGGEAEFNVAIRTLAVPAAGERAIMGLGSGIVADSRPADEWRECLAKGAFVNDPGRSVDLIETMRFEPVGGLAELDRHLSRIKASADSLGFPFDRHEARNELQAATFRVSATSKVRLLLSRTGAIAIEVRPLGLSPGEPVAVKVEPRTVRAHDFRLRHKTTDRAFYDDARRASGAFELLFTDEAGFLTEGSFTSLFVERQGRLVTPPLVRGLLPGVLRQKLLDEERAVEGDLVEADLVGGFLIGNAARGLIRARLA